MKKHFCYLSLFIVAFFYSPTASGFAVDVHPSVKKMEKAEKSTSVSTKKLTKRQLRKIKRQERKRKRLEKRLKKFQKKWEMKAQKRKKNKRFFGGVTDEPQFQLGLILILIAILVGIFSALPILGSVFSLVSGIIGLVGLVLILLALLSYY